MLKACKIEATLMNSPFSAKYRPGQILGAVILHQSPYFVKMRGCSDLPPSKAEDKRRGIRHTGEIELAITYESFRAELVGVLVQFRIMRASPIILKRYQ